MLGIHKSAEPVFLREYREKTPDASYEGLAEKEQLRQQLYQDQGGLCAYCMRRVHNKRDETGNLDFTIEHWTPQSEGSRDLHWPDLLGVCSGNLRGHIICDKARGDQPLKVHPARHHQTMENNCRYLGDGSITIDDQTEKLLNLNAPPLLQNRKVVWDALLQRSIRADITDLRAELRQWQMCDRKGLRREFAGVAIYFLQKTIEQKEKKSERLRGASR